jgi:outer membrane protein TolC
MSRNELKPVLDFVLETYVAGLRGDVDIGRAFADQFSVGEPGYTAGLVFEVPLGRRAALAKMRRRKLELRQITERFEEELQTVLSEVEVAVREVGATHGEMLGKFRAMKAAEAEVDYATRRWEVLPGEDRSASFLLEDLLDAQDRLALEEFGFAAAQRDYAISLTALNRATGTLLQQEQIEPVRMCQEGLPFLQFEKSRRALPTPEELPPALDAPR